MPRLASNQDAQEGSHGTALMIAGSIFAGAAIAGAIGNAKAIKAFTKQYSDDDVLKTLYGKKSKKLNDIAKTYAESVSSDPSKGYMYEMGKTFTGAPKFVKQKITPTNVVNDADEVVKTKYHKSGSMIGDTVRTYMDKDLRKLNKEMKALYKGRGDEIYSKSKLALYDHLSETSKGMNVNTKNLTDATSKIYNSKSNAVFRDKLAQTKEGLASDIDITNSIWKVAKPGPIKWKQQPYDIDAQLYANGSRNPVSILSPKGLKAGAENIANKSGFIDPFEKMPKDSITRKNLFAEGGPNVNIKPNRSNSIDEYYSKYGY